MMASSEWESTMVLYRFSDFSLVSFGSLYRWTMQIHLTDGYHYQTLSLQAQKLPFSTNPSHLRLLLPTGLPLWQLDWTGPIMLIVLFLVSHFNFLFIPCGRLSWLPVSFLLHVKYTLSYRIVMREGAMHIVWRRCVVLGCRRKHQRHYIIV